MGKWVHVETASSSFHAKVIQARLAAEGIPAALRGFSEGPYPLAGNVQVYVSPADEQLAREVLLADQIDAAFAEPMPRSPRRNARRSLFRRRGAV